MRLATRILRLGMSRSKADALAGDLAEDLTRRGYAPVVRTPFLLVLAVGYALLGLGARLTRLFQPLDLKLAVRMLVKFPGLTAMAVFSMAIAIACGTLTVAIYSFLWPSLPLPDGDRIVSIENYDTRYRNDDRQAFHDFLVWRDELKTLVDVGAFISTRRNLITSSGAVEQVALAQMSAAGFRVAQAAPLMGRALEDRDEAPAAEPVMVIGEALWRRSFNGDPSVVGRTARLGSTVHTIVGVMPESFGFPVNHGLWVPLRLDPHAFERGSGPSIDVFAKLAPGIDQDAAESELLALGTRLAQTFPDSNANLRPRIVPYSSVFADFDDIEDLYMFEAMALMLVIVIAVNVAILLYARTVTRAGEIAVRAALGASRARIVSQLFLEAAALAAVAGIAGLAILKIVFVQFHSVIGTFIPGGAPFWMDLSISPRLVITAAALSLLAAAIAGIVPALKVTGRRVHAGLQDFMTRGGGLRLGKGWTALVVGQVAITAAMLPAAAMIAYSSVRFADADPGFDAGHFVVADLGLDVEQTPQARATYTARFNAREADLRRALASEPGVTAITTLWTIPGREPNMRITLDGADAERHLIRFMRVDHEYFPAFGVTVFAGRAFTQADTAAPSTAVVVNQHFVDRFLRGRPVLGQRIRYVPNQEPDKPAMAQDGVKLPGVYEIVGVVSNMPARELSATAATARVYHPMSPENVHSSIGIRVPAEQSDAIASRVRELAAAIDPSFRANRVRPLLEIYQGDKIEARWGAVLMAGITIAVMVPAGGGIYALMSVTVSRRRREIGIRAALGGDPRRIFGAIFGRAVLLLSAGAALGVVPAIVMIQEDAKEMFSGPVSSWEIAAVYAGVVLFLVGMGAVAACGPARRGLRIHPTEALRAD